MDRGPAGASSSDEERGVEEAPVPEGGGSLGVVGGELAGVDGGLFEDAGGDVDGEGEGDASTQPWAPTGSPSAFERDHETESR